ncbi:expressed unknown protein [Seminavis robusta]|uniref:Uncharacterized protein n=1 Tax=Seminavis robusta TaxID=568900 RepID=A0A9N8DNG5_9STRA|nr:expressed unknown protein [Seminavis robusta]|eukprot:Sro153_g069680.1 n/a (368) ;mRNA; r:40064-41167
MTNSVDPTLLPVVDGNENPPARPPTVAAPAPGATSAAMLGAIPHQQNGNAPYVQPPAPNRIPHGHAPIPFGYPLAPANGQCPHPGWQPSPCPHPAPTTATALPPSRPSTTINPQQYVQPPTGHEAPSTQTLEQKMDAVMAMLGIQDRDGGSMVRVLVPSSGGGSMVWAQVPSATIQYSGTLFSQQGDEDGDLEDERAAAFTVLIKQQLEQLFKEIHTKLDLAFGTGTPDVIKQSLDPLFKEIHTKLDLAFGTGTPDVIKQFLDPTHGTIQQQLEKILASLRKEAIQNRESERRERCFQDIMGAFTALDNEIGELATDEVGGLENLKNTAVAGLRKKIGDLTKVIAKLNTIVDKVDTLFDDYETQEEK